MNFADIEIRTGKPYLLRTGEIVTAHTVIKRRLKPQHSRLRSFLEVRPLGAPDSARFEVLPSAFVGEALPAPTGSPAAGVPAPV